MQALPIGYFQFDNLVRNRIPFLFVSEELPFAEVYEKAEVEHLARYQFQGSQEAKTILSFLEINKYPPHYAILCLCSDGTKSKLLAQELTELGAQNCYFVLDGWAGIKAEATNP